MKKMTALQALVAIGMTIEGANRVLEISAVRPDEPAVTRIYPTWRSKIKKSTFAELNAGGRNHTSVYRGKNKHEVEVGLHRNEMCRADSDKVTMPR